MPKRPAESYEIEDLSELLDDWEWKKIQAHPQMITDALRAQTPKLDPYQKGMIGFVIERALDEAPSSNASDQKKLRDLQFDIGLSTEEKHLEVLNKIVSLAEDAITKGDKLPDSTIWKALQASGYTFHALGQKSKVPELFYTYENSPSISNAEALLDALAGDSVKDDEDVVLSDSVQDDEDDLMVGVMDALDRAMRDVKLSSSAAQKRHRR